MTQRPEIVRRLGGWFVTFPDGWSGPWHSEEAAELARDRKFDEAHKAERPKSKSPPA